MLLMLPFGAHDDPQAPQLFRSEARLKHAPVQMPSKHQVGQNVSPAGHMH